MFKATLLVFMLAALSVAHPGSGNKFPSSAHHKLARQASNINSTNDDNSTSVVSNEVLPNFVLPCKCAEPFCDSRMSSKSICLCKEAAKMGCYLASTQAGANTEGGCPKPDDNACANA